MTTHADLTEGSDQRIVADRALGEWADRLLEQAGLGVTIVDRSLVQRLAARGSTSGAGNTGARTYQRD
jgi:hypothetical protein